jgi:Tol biopolymer transport system component/C-terminal processing protease CtpA/Prc
MRRLAPFLFAASTAFSAGIPYLTQPALCPTRPELAFVSGGDIWVAPAKGGEAHLLVSNAADDSRPLYSPDGSKLAFVSTRTGAGDIYILTLASGDLKRLTFDDRLDQLDAWSRDGKWIYFSNTGNDVGGKNDIYRVSIEGGTPMAVSADRFTNEFQAAPAPDGSTIALAARGNGDSQWWRNGHSHLDESEIWVRKEGTPATYEKLVDLNGRNAWPNWTPDGKQLYFMSDRSGAQNIWTTSVGAPPAAAKPRQVTKFTTGRVLWPSMSYDGKSIVFERDFKIWQLDVKTGESYPIPITLVGSAASPEISHSTFNTYNDLAVSGDNRKIALTAHGELFASSARDGGQAFRVTNTPGPESQAIWAPDSTHLAYLSQRDALTHIYIYDFVKHAETQLTNGPLPDQSPVYSPDGKSLAFVRDRKELRVVDLESKQERLLATGFIGSAFGGPSIAWAPDNKWIAYAGDTERGLRNVFVVPAAGGAPKQVTFLANGSLGGLNWSADGKFLIFETSQRTEQPEVMRLDLVARQPKFAEEKFEDLFKPEAAAPQGRGGNAAPRPKPVEKVDIEFDNIRRRITTLQLGTGVNNPQISPDGKYLLFSAAAAGQANLYLYTIDEDAAGGGRGGRGGGGRGGDGIRGVRQLTTTPGQKSHPHFSADSREVYFLESGRVQSINIDNRQARSVNVDAEMDIDFQKEKLAVFEEAWAGQRDGYYDPKYHGADWNAIRKTYQPLIEGCRTPDEMRAILRLMIGELNSSHSGVTAPTGAGGGRGSVGQLGLSFDRAAYEKEGKLKINGVLPLSPAAIAKIQPGQELEAIDGVAIGPRVNLDEQLQHKADKRVTLKISGHDITLLPAASLSDLLYRNWVEDNRAYVAKISSGRLGYVHIKDMSEQALTQLYTDLDAENRARQGVVIDIRNNNGGFVNAYALDVLTRRPYLTMTNRGGPDVPARTNLGQRSLELPTILVVNQHSLSDAEDFTEGYRTLKLGKVVGEPTAGWIIYTGAMNLIDGSTMRMPSTRITGADGKEMENNPRPVDIAVTRPIGESYTGKDSQLDAAVHELLAELPAK